LYIPFIYLTAYGSEEFIEKIMQTQPAGYIMKPYNKPTLLSNIKIAIDAQNRLEQNSTNPEEVFLKTRVGIYKFISKQIYYMQSNKNYVEIFTTEGKFEVREKLETILNLLHFKVLYRIHRRYVVNIDFVTQIKDEMVYINKTAIPMSKSYNAENLIKNCIKS